MPQPLDQDDITNIKFFIFAAAAWLYAFTIAAATPEYEPGVILVKFTAKAGPSTRSAARARVAASVAKRFGLVGIEQWRLGTSIDAVEASKRIGALPGVQYAQPNYIHHAQLTPNDTRYSDLWGLNNTGQSGGTPDADIDAAAAWNIATGTATIVAVIDTGVDYHHSDLASNMWHNPGEIPGNGIDDDGNGYADDVYGIDASNNDADPMDDHNHGTHIAGTIAGVGNNGIGVVGVCWRARIMACKFLDSSGNGTSADAIECIQYAVRMGARVVNTSWGGGGNERALFDAIEVANKSNVLICAAAGNSHGNNDTNPFYPASYTNENILAVMATDGNDAPAPFSNYGSNAVDIAAPGVSILSTIIGGAYGWLDGTSMATPYCVGAAALLHAANPELNVVQLKAALMTNADKKPALTGLCRSGGRLNVFHALQNVAGAISFDRARYPTQTWALVTLVDTDFGMLSTTSAHLRSSAGDAETITLAAKGVGSFFFTNRVYIGYGQPVPGNGVLEAEHGTTIDAFYYDASRAASITGSAVVDIHAPLISGMGTTNIGRCSATIVWQTSEEADSTVRYGTSPGALTTAAHSASPCTTHRLTLNNLAQATVYSFSVESVDDAANRAISDTNSFITMLFVGTLYDFEAGGMSGWTHAGSNDEWEWGIPTAGPASARSLSHCWGTDLDSTYSANADATLLSPELLVPSHAQFVYSQWYDTEPYYDYGFLEITTNHGASWYELAPAIMGSSGDWRDETIDFGRYAGMTVQVRFRFTSDSSLEYEGWFIDDVGIGRTSDAIDPMTIKRASFRFPWTKGKSDRAKCAGSLICTTTTGMHDLATAPLTIRFGSNRFFTAALPTRSHQSGKGCRARYLTVSTNTHELTKGFLTARPVTTGGKEDILVKFWFSTRHATLFDQFGFAFNPATSTSDTIYQFELIIGSNALHGSTTSAVSYRNTQDRNCSGRLKKENK